MCTQTSKDYKYIFTFILNQWQNQNVIGHNKNQTRKTEVPMQPLFYQFLPILFNVFLELPLKSLSWVTVKGDKDTEQVTIPTYKEKIYSETYVISTFEETHLSLPEF